ncbi:MAG: DUF2007 domain-containing protein [Bellilinea sp.]
MTSPEYIEVYSANGQLEADMIRLMLEAVGLHVLTRGESAGAVYGLTVGPLGEVRVLVLASEVQAANELLTALEDGQLENPSPDSYPPAAPEDDDSELE